ncbi:MAG TPA: hypothetical protein VKR55_27610 [Bradyrhizobium sp.]|uniref:hypothetical protein n=1 Tax=Bradyrhizobium sp. TaxID=376 RepID=UPI002CBEC8DA|nr:hypothetical protein [Bradyrhizobium sp.]HLZ05904.1 hypothetical protein [Bradyrhizobium sp.]
MGSDHIFFHVRIVLAIVLGLSITKLLNGIALLIERRDSWSLIHMSWVLWALMSVMTFWWWEFALSRVPTWTFSSYLFVIIYCSLYFVLSALLFPDDAEKYGRYEDYLIERRYWFFGLIALITLMDMIDTSLKGAARWHMLGIAYPIKTGVMLVIAGTGMIFINKRAHLVLALIALVYLTAYYSVEYLNVAA